MGTPECCEKCGYLGIRNAATLQLVEVDEAFRELAITPPGLNGLKSVYTGKPVCAVMAHDLASECKASHGQPVLDVFRLKRDCGDRGKSITWQRGFTPKEHVEMQLLDEQRAWQEQQAEKAENRHLEAMRTQRFTALIAAVIGFIAGLAAVSLARLLG